MITNLQLLINKYDSVTLDMDQLAEVLHMKTKSLLNSISAGRFQIPTYRTGRKRLVNIVDVAEFLDARK